MKIIIGLGNPDNQYHRTRHNIGFRTIEEIAKESDAKFKAEPKLSAEISKGRFAEKPVILVKPRTFVNNSGLAAKKVKNYYKAKNEEVILIHDDLDIEFGSFKISFGKDSGGHKGVQSVIDSLKTNKFWRLRIGTANRKLTTARHQKTLKAKKAEVGDFVLSKFTPAEEIQLKKVIRQSLERLASAR